MTNPPPPPAAAAPRKPSADKDPEQLIGTLIAGRYVVEKAIGRGGMGVVYLAKQNNLNRMVVVKVLRSGLVDDEEAMARFEREAQGLSLLQHPNIVTIHDFGHEEDRAYIVMEFVEGETISRYLRREGPMRLMKFLQVAAQILEGISAAHERGLLHRDIKPANIMMVRKGESDHFVKILDFGLAKLNNGESDVTREQTLVGSAAFMAPEQIVGLEITEALDVYALGVLFYYMLSGKRPFSAPSDTAMLYKHVHEAPEPLAGALPQGHDIPEPLIQLIERCLAKNPKQRPANAGALLEHLVSEITGSSRVQMPWSRTDLSAVGTGSNPGSVAVGIGGGSLSLNLGAPTGNSAPALAAASGNTSLTFVRTSDGQLHQVVPIDGTSQSFSGERSMVITTMPPKRSALVPVLLVVVLLACAGIIAYLMINRPDAPSAGASIPGAPQQNTSPTTDPAANPATQQAAVTQPPPPPTQPPPPDPAAEEAALSAQLDRIDALITSGQIGDAQAALDIVNERDLSRFSTQLERAVKQRKTLQIETLTRKAARREQDNDLDGALAAFEEILTLHPDHTSAAEQMQRLRDLKKAKARGTLTVQLSAAVSDAKIEIDGLTLEPNTLPLRQELPEGTYHYRIKAEGYKTLEGDVIITLGQANTLTLSLEKARKKDSGGGNKNNGLLPVGDGKSGGLLPP